MVVVGMRCERGELGLSPQGGLLSYRVVEHLGYISRAAHAIPQFPARKPELLAPADVFGQICAEDPLRLRVITIAGLTAGSCVAIR
jgi:hypothetical protein